MSRAVPYGHVCAVCECDDCAAWRARQSTAPRPKTTVVITLVIEAHDAATALESVIDALDAGSLQDTIAECVYDNGSAKVIVSTAAVMPPVNPRRPYYENQPGYLESLNDWYANNEEAVEWFLENAEAVS